jgi:membrane-bound ClpP family serine protease
MFDKLRNLPALLQLLKKSRQAKRNPNTRRVVGLIGRTDSGISNVGSVFVANELWPARSDVPIACGEKVRIIGLSRDGLSLVVERVPF